jgi:hypothetical protein
LRFGERREDCHVKVALGAVCVFAALFYFAVSAGVKHHDHGMKAVVEDSVPSIQAAQEIKANLADMHTQAANILLDDAAAPKYFDDRRSTRSTTNRLFGLMPSTARCPVG